MTRKDYVLLAAAFAATMPPAQTPPDAREFQWMMDVNRIADVLDRENPRFDRGRFIAACKAPTQA